MTPEERATQYARDIKQALKSFGEYSYYDKGPREVMTLPTEELMKLPVEDVSETLKLVLKKSPKHGEKFIQDLLEGMDEWDKFDDLLGQHEWLRDHY